MITREMIAPVFSSVYPFVKLGHGDMSSAPVLFRRAMDACATAKVRRSSSSVMTWKISGWSLQICRPDALVVFESVAGAFRVCVQSCLEHLVSRNLTKLNVNTASVRHCLP